MDDNKIMQLVNCMKKAKKSGYCVFGIRVMDGSLKIGDSVPDSYDWDIVNDCSTYVTTGETLGGACAVLSTIRYCFLMEVTTTKLFKKYRRQLREAKITMENTFI